MQSIQALSNSNLDVSSLKKIISEISSSLNLYISELDYQKNQITFLLDLLVKNKMITEEEKEDYINSLKLRYSPENKDINSSIFSLIQNLTAEQKKAIKYNSNFKGFFGSLAKLEEEFPATNSNHGWRAIVAENTDDFYRKGALMEYVFSIDHSAWQPSNEKTVLRNYFDRIESLIPGREKGVPLNGDIISYVGNEYKWKSFTKTELDLASKELLDFLISSVFSLTVSNGRVSVPTLEELQTAKGNTLKTVKGMSKEDILENYKDSWFVSRSSISDIINQIHNDYMKVVEVDFTDGTASNGIKRPFLKRISSSKKTLIVNGVEKSIFVEDYDENDKPINKNINNFVLDDILNTMNKDFSREHEVLIETAAGSSQNRIKEVLPSGAEVSVELDKKIPKNVSSEQLNKVIKQINDDYFNVIPSLGTETYNSFLTSFVNSYVSDSNERASILTRLSKAGNISKVYTSPAVNVKNQRITVDTINGLISDLRDLIGKVDIARDEVFERNNSYNGVKTFKDNVILEKLLNVFGLVTLNGGLNVVGPTNFNGNVSFTGGRILFNEISSLVNVQSPVMVIRDSTIELNRPTVEEGVQPPPEFARWIEQANNGHGGVKVFRGTDLDLKAYWSGYSEYRKTLVAGYISKNVDGTDNETQEEIMNLKRLAIVEDSVVNGKVVSWNEVNQSLETKENVDLNIQGAIYKNFLVTSAEKISGGLTPGIFVSIVNGKFVKADLTSVEKADVLGYVSEIVASGSDFIIKVILNGVIPLNHNFAHGSTIYLQPDGTISDGYSYDTNVHYLVKTLGKFFSGNLVNIRVDKTESYKTIEIINSNETSAENFNSTIENLTVLPSKFTQGVPLSITDGNYSVYSYAVHKEKLLGFAKDYLTNQSELLTSGDKMFFANALSYPIGTVLYLKDDNTISNTKTKIQVGTLVSQNQILLNIYVEPDVVYSEIISNLDAGETIEPVRKTEVTMTANSCCEISIDNFEPTEFLVVETSTLSFNSMYVIKSNDLMNVSDIKFSKSLGIFYLVNNGSAVKLYYRALVGQKMIVKDNLTITNGVAVPTSGIIASITK